MRYGYDLENPIEREMYFKSREKDFQRANDNTKTIGEKYAEIMQERQKEMQYFIERDKREKALEKELQEQIEKQLPELLEKTLADLLKGF